MSQIKFFQPGDDTTAEWHAYREESPAALCGEATLSYNRDRVSDFVPSDGGLHVGCREAIDAENPTPYQPAEEAPAEDAGEPTADDQTAAAEADSQPADDAAADAGQPSDDGVPADDAAAADSGDQPTDQPQQ